MYQKDYILRMIEMLGDLLAAILGLIKKGDYINASEELGRIYYDMLKEDAAFFRSIPEANLTSKLMKEHNFTNGHLEILAELFNAEAELENAKGNKPGSLEYFKKSLLLFEFIDREQKTLYPERLGKMAEIRKRIEEIKLG
ncbi:MAG TPA: hypothetical protein DEO60_10885 [Bacteroidales bacterium]|nr:hypothetical protein [Bacteroidales bacterium]HBZ21627.1 hypothetical protein [Bacteroidales bacterium]